MQDNNLSLQQSGQPTNSTCAGRPTQTLNNTWWPNNTYSKAGWSCPHSVSPRLGIQILFKALSSPFCTSEEGCCQQECTGCSLVQGCMGCLLVRGCTGCSLVWGCMGCSLVQGCTGTVLVISVILGCQGRKKCCYEGNDKLEPLGRLSNNLTSQRRPLEDVHLSDFEVFHPCSLLPGIICRLGCDFCIV